MKILFSLILIISSICRLYSVEEIGIDSGYRSIFLESNNKSSETALLIIGGIHGDESGTIRVVEYLIDNLKTELSAYFIPEINPTLSNIEIRSDRGVTIKEGRRGYLKEHLNRDGFLKPGSDLSLFSKDLYYRIFYGNNQVYNNGIKHYVDPNRDFINLSLPSTRILVSLFNELKKRHSLVIVLSLHGYMSGGRVYPEYRLEDDKIVIESSTEKMCRDFESGSNYIYKEFYIPAIPIKERFQGELIHYTGKDKGLTGLDIELDKSSDKNSEKVLGGIKELIRGLEEEH